MVEDIVRLLLAVSGFSLIFSVFHILSPVIRGVLIVVLATFLANYFYVLRVGYLDPFTALGFALDFVLAAFAATILIFSLTYFERKIAGFNSPIVKWSLCLVGCLLLVYPFSKYVMLEIK